MLNVRSFSMSSYEGPHPILFVLFMLVVSVPFLAGETGRLFYGVGSFQIAGIFGLLAGVTYRHKENIVKPIHYVASGLAIGFGFYAIWSLESLYMFGLMLVLPVIFDRIRFLLWLEAAAFLTIYTFKHFPWN